MLAVVRVGTGRVAGSVRRRVRVDGWWRVGSWRREEAVRLLVVGKVRDGGRGVRKVVGVGMVLLILRREGRRRG